MRVNLSSLSGKEKELPFDPATVPALFLPGLAAKLARKLNRTLALEVNIARLKGRLHGENGEERFHDFIYQLGRPAQFESFLSEYPVLVRALLGTVEQWTKNTFEFLNRLALDWPEVRSTFSTAQPPGLLVAVEGEAGDSHRGFLENNQHQPGESYKPG